MQPHTISGGVGSRVETGLFYKLAVFLILISLASYSLLLFSQLLYKWDMAPYFGYKYVVTGKGGPLKGTVARPGADIPELYSEQIDTDSVIFSSNIVIPEAGSYRFRIGTPDKAELYINGKKMGIDSRNNFTHLNLIKGVMSLRLRYSLRRGIPEDMGLNIDRGVFSRHLAAYLFRVPGSSTSAVASGILSFINSYKDWGYILALLFFAFSVPLTLFKSRSTKERGDKRASPGFLVFMFISSLFGSVLGLIYLNQRLGPLLPDPVLILISLAVTVAYIVRLENPSFMDSSFFYYTGILILIALIVTGGIWMQSGVLLPVDPVGSGDLTNHMEMVDHYTVHNKIKTDEERMIYPQALHVLLSIGSAVSGVSAIKLLTPFLLIMLIATYFILFRLMKYFYPEAGFAHFLPALIVSNPGFIYETLFRFYYFPQIVALFFYLTAVFMVCRSRRIVASLMLGSAIIVYPYFAPFFLFTLFFIGAQVIAGERDLRGNRFLIHTGLFTYPLALLGIYIYIYINFSFPQIQEGYNAVAKLNPFAAVNPLFISLFLIGSVLAVIKKRGDVALFVTVHILAFACYYVPYLLKGIGTTYYMTKLMFLLSFAGMIPVAGAIAYLTGRLKSLRHNREVRGGAVYVQR